MQLTQWFFELTTTTDWHFPSSDQGFRGSAWHGRIHNMVLQNSQLTALLQGGGVGYHLEHAEPYALDDSQTTPFHQPWVKEGEKQVLGIIMIGVLPNDALTQAWQQVIRASGQWQLDPNKMTTYLQTQRWLGEFDSRLIDIKTYPTVLFKKPSTKDVKGLRLHLRSPLRLDDGQSLEQAQLGLQKKQMMVPKLTELVNKLSNRLEKYKLLEGDFKIWFEKSSQVVHDLSDACYPEAAAIYPFDLWRHSAHANRSDPLGGLLGWADYRTHATYFEAIYPLLKLAEWVRIGRKTGLGLGRVGVEILYQV